MAKFLDTIFDNTISGLNRTMDLTFRRNKAIVSNITNAETPLYRAVDMTFAKELDAAFGQQNETLAKTSSAHMDVTSSQEAHFVSDLSGATKPDGNNVDLDLQMGRLALNSGEYANAARLIKRQLGIIRSAIRTGER